MRIESNRHEEGIRNYYKRRACFNIFKRLFNYKYIYTYMKDDAELSKIFESIRIGQLG